MAAGYERQLRVRDEYRRRRPEWTDSVTRYRELAGRLAPPGARVLDLGCGRNALHGNDLACTPGAHVVGVDADLAALVENRGLDVRAAASAETLPFAGGVFDVVACAWVLEHLEHPGLVFSEAHRVLRPGGHFLFLTPNAWNYNAWLIRAVPNRWHQPLAARLYGRGGGDAYPVRYRANSAAALRRLLFAAGFGTVDLAFNGDHSYVAFNRPLLELAIGVERLLALPALARSRVHILGMAQA
jgi:SAM-dependent methyltransferase